MNLKIKNAINYFNDNRIEGVDKMNQQKLGEKVLPDMNPKTAGWYISRWCDGEELGKLRPAHVITICDTCGVDPNFLFDYNQ